MYVCAYMRSLPGKCSCCQSLHAVVDFGPDRELVINYDYKDIIRRRSKEVNLRKTNWSSYYILVLVVTSRWLSARKGKDEATIGPLAESQTYVLLQR